MSQPVHRPGFVDVATYLKLPRDPETWLLRPLIPVGGAALVYAPPKVGKSFLGIQLALALSGSTPDWLGFAVGKVGRVLILQLDTPRSTWSKRFEDLIKKGAVSPTSNIRLADRETVEHFPFDILQPSHMSYLRTLVSMQSPVAVIVDTLREVHSGDEDNSTVARNVISNLVAATAPAALILISHARKAHPDMDRSLMDDNRGSSYVTGRMDAIIRLGKTRMYYTGRSIEEGDIRLERLDSGLWAPVVDNADVVIDRVLGDNTLNTLRAKARALAPLIHTSEEAAMSRLRRLISAHPPKEVVPHASSIV